MTGVSKNARGPERLKKRNERHRNRNEGSSAELDVAFRSADEGVKAGFVAALNREVEADTLERRGEFLGTGAQDFKIIQLATCGSVFRRVDRIGTPFDEKGEKAAAVVREIDGFPVEYAAIGKFSGAVVRAGEGNLIFAELFDDGGDVRGMDGPADEARLGHLADLREVDDLFLGGIGSDDFQVAAFAKRQKGVARAAAGMDSADGGADTGGLFDRFDAAIEIVAAENDVIEQSGHVIVRVFGVRGQDKGRNGQSAAGEREEISARKDW